MSEDLLFNAKNPAVLARWIRFVPMDNGRRKTKIWVVYTLEGNTHLGEIRWYAPWRKYAFFPLFMTVFEPDCMDSISGFMRSQTDKRREARRLERLRDAPEVPAPWRL